MASENKDDRPSRGFAFSLGRFVWQYWYVLVALLLLAVVIAWQSPVGGLIAPGIKTNVNIVSIGGWNIWWFIAFWMLSQWILIHHARRK